jgi:hypothetical protein
MAGSLSAGWMRGGLMNQLIQVGLRVGAGEEADSEELADLAVRLRAELLELDVERVDLVSAGPAPVGTRAGEALMAGALIASLIQSPGLLAAVVDAVRLWASRDGRCSVRLELDGDVLEVAGVSSDQQRQLIQAWIDRAVAKDDVRD